MPPNAPELTWQQAMQQEMDAMRHDLNNLRGIVRLLLDRIHAQVKS